MVKIGNQGARTFAPSPDQRTSPGVGHHERGVAGKAQALGRGLLGMGREIVDTPGELPTFASTVSVSASAMKPSLLSASNALRGGGRGALIGAVIELGRSAYRCVGAVRSGTMTKAEAVKQVAKDGAVGATVGGVAAAVTAVAFGANVRLLSRALGGILSFGGQMIGLTIGMSAGMFVHNRLRPPSAPGGARRP